MLSDLAQNASRTDAGICGASLAIKAQQHTACTLDRKTCATLFCKASASRLWRHRVLDRIVPF